MPTANADVVNVAIPPLSVPVPIGLPPSRKVIPEHARRPHRPDR